MPNKTLSVRDDDLALWERAERAAKTDRTTVSALVASALAEKLGQTGTCQVQMYEWPKNTPVRIEAFEGRWLTDQPDYDQAYTTHERAYKIQQDPPTWFTHIAETGRGRIAVYVHHYNMSYDEPPLFEVFDTVDDAYRALSGDHRVDRDAFISATQALQSNDHGRRDQEVRWRDI